MGSTLMTGGNTREKHVGSNHSPKGSGSTSRLLKQKWQKGKEAKRKGEKFGVRACDLQHVSGTL